MNNERKLFSAYPTTHTNPYNEKPPLNEPIRTSKHGNFVMFFINTICVLEKMQPVIQHRIILADILTYLMKISKKT